MTKIWAKILVQCLPSVQGLGHQGRERGPAGGRRTATADTDPSGSDTCTQPATAGATVRCGSDCRAGAGRERGENN